MMITHPEVDKAQNYFVPRGTLFHNLPMSVGLHPFSPSLLDDNITFDLTVLAT